MQTLGPKTRTAVLTLLVPYYVFVVLAHQRVSDLVSATFGLFRQWFPPPDYSSSLLLQRLIIACAVLAFLGYAAAIAWRHRHATGRATATVLSLWVIYSGLLISSYYTFGQFATELVHYFQYMALGLALMAADPRPRTVLVVGTLLGAIDEAFQFATLNNFGYRPRIWYFDWNDIVLNQLGIIGGILPFITERLLSQAGARLRGLDLKALLVACGSSLGLLLLTMVPPGYGPDRPFLLGYAGQHYHILNTAEGLAILAGLTLIAFSVLGRPSGQERQLAAHLKGGPVMGAVGALLMLALASQGIGQPTWRDELEASDWRNHPQATCQRTWAPIVIDGRPTEAAWQTAEPLELSLDRWGEAIPGAATTRVQTLWDSEHLYVAFECQDTDIWALSKEHDDPTLPLHEVVEIFIDTGAMARAYVEVELSPANVVYDLFVLYHAPNSDWPPRPHHQDFTALPAWDARGLRSAVWLDGSLEAGEPDTGWSAEIAIPFADLPVLRYQPPRDGQRWRVNFYRVERPGHPAAAAPGLGHGIAASWGTQHGEPILSCWSPPADASFHRPFRFGSLVFEDSPPPGKDGQ